MKDLKDFDNQIFDDKYFENLYENIMKRIEGKIVCIRDMFILENEFLDSECVQVESLKSYNKVNKFLQKLLFGEEKLNFYYSNLLESKGFEILPILMYKDGGVYREVVTGCCLPIIGFSWEYYLNAFSSKLYCLSECYDGNGSRHYEKIDLVSTNFIIFQINGYSQYSNDSNYINKISESELIKKSFSNQVASRENIEEYVRRFSDEYNYMNLIEFFFSNSDQIKFNKYYNVPPNIPAKLIPYYEKMKSSNQLSKRKSLLLSDIKPEKKIDEIVDKSLIGLEAILEIKNMIQKLDKEEQSKFYEELDKIINEYKNISIGKDYKLGMEFQQKLYKLRAEIQVCGNRKFNIEFVNRYFNYFYDVSKNEFPSEELNLKVDELFRYINYFLANKKNIEFSSYFETQELIFKILTNIIILNPNVREKIIGEVSNLYLKGIQNNLERFLINCVDELNEDDPNKFSIYSLPLEEIKDIDYIINSLNIIDKLGKEFILDCISKNDKRLGNVKVKK